MKPVIFTVCAIRDAEANVWSGHCDQIPAAADAQTLDELLDRISHMALDVAPDNHPGLDADTVFIQVMATREATAARERRRHSTVRCGSCSRRRHAHSFGRDAAVTKSAATR